MASILYSLLLAGMVSVLHFSLPSNNRQRRFRDICKSQSSVWTLVDMLFGGLWLQLFNASKAQYKLTHISLLSLIENVTTNSNTLAVGVVIK